MDLPCSSWGDTSNSQATHLSASPPFWESALVLCGTVGNEGSLSSVSAHLLHGITLKAPSPPSYPINKKNDVSMQKLKNWY